MHALSASPARWFPATLTTGAEGSPVIRWIHMEDQSFSEAFLNETLQKWMRRPANAAFAPRTTFAEVREMARSHPGMAPSGLIFHVSRCGSTLLSRYLGLLPGALVLSEPPLFDRLVRFNDREPKISHDEQVETLRAAVSAMGRPRALDQTRFFLKLDAWHLFYAPLIREAFPETPWLFLYRDPLEVLVSQLAQRGVHTVPGFLPAHRFDPGQGWDGGAHAQTEYCARVLGGLYKAGLELDPRGDGLLNYSELPTALSSTVAARFGFSPDAGFTRAVDEAGRMDVKRSGPFVSDSERKRAGATQDVRDAAVEHMNPAYRALESRRLASRPPGA